jgi:hypothetical protein
MQSLCDKQQQDILLVARGAGLHGVVPRYHVGALGLPRTGSHSLPLGFPLLECGPTGPLGPSAVFGRILTNKHQQETRSGAVDTTNHKVVRADALVSTEQHGQCVARMGGVCRRR